MSVDVVSEPIDAWEVHDVPEPLTRQIHTPVHAVLFCADETLMLTVHVPPSHVSFAIAPLWKNAP